MSTDIRTKYLKYKTKYLELKKKMEGSGKEKEKEITINTLDELNKLLPKERKDITTLVFGDEFNQPLINDKESILVGFNSVKKIYFGENFNQPLIEAYNDNDEIIELKEVNVSTGSYTIFSAFSVLPKLEMIQFGKNFNQTLKFINKKAANHKQPSHPKLFQIFLNVDYFFHLENAIKDLMSRYKEPPSTKLDVQILNIRYNSPYDRLYTDIHIDLYFINTENINLYISNFDNIIKTLQDNTKFETGIYTELPCRYAKRVFENLYYFLLLLKNKYKYNYENKNDNPNEMVAQLCEE
jgi:hypothetical protein